MNAFGRIGTRINHLSLRAKVILVFLFLITVLAVTNEISFITLSIVTAIFIAAFTWIIRSAQPVWELTAQKAELEVQQKQLLALNEELEESLKALDESQGIIYALAVAVEAKDTYTRGHSERVSEYSLRLGSALGLTPKELEIIEGAALLHDIGKIGVSGSILRKPGPLTALEFQQVKKHPAIGERICSSLKFARDMLPIIRHHHEHYNGMGYPDGIKGDKIPLMARIVAVADAFDAMTSDRPYRPGMTPEKALSIMSEGAGTQWDPQLVRVFSGIVWKQTNRMANDLKNANEVSS